MKTPLEKWWWIDFATNADTADVNKAKKSAGGSERGLLSKNLPFTEEDYRFVLLNDHVKIGQINPKAMRRLQRKYLDYIAGMDFPHPDLQKENVHALVKMQGNVSRAKHELTKRNLFWATLFTGIAALAGAIIGGLLSVK